MKKIYLNPVNRVIDLGINGDMCQIISASSDTPATTETGVDDVDYEGSALSRDNVNIWDKEW